MYTVDMDLEKFFDKVNKLMSFRGAFLISVWLEK